MRSTALVLAVLLCLLLLFAPGWLVLAAAGVDRVVALAWAPAPSILVLVASGALTRLLDFRIDTAEGVATYLCVALAFVAMGRQLRRRTVAPVLRRGDAVGLTVGVAVGAVGFALSFAHSIGTLLAWPQMPDNIWHVGTTTWMARQGSAWIGDASMYGQPTHPPVSYPGVFYAITSTLSTWSGVSPLAACHVAVVVVAGVVWPAAMVALAWQVLDTSRLTTIAAVAASFAVFSFPFRPLTVGVLWPFLLAHALLPLVLAGAHLALTTSRQAKSRLTAWSLVCAAAAALALSHPSAAYSALLLGAPLALSILIRRHFRWRKVLWICIALVLLGAWSIRPQSMLTNRADVEPLSLGTTAALLPGFLSPVLPVALGLAAAACTGLAVAWRTRRRRWLVWSAAAPVVIAVVAMTAPGAWSRGLLWPWWNDPLRLLTLSTVPIVLALVTLSHWVSVVLRRHRVLRERAEPWTVFGVAVVSVIGILSGTALIGTTYDPRGAGNWWATPAEQSALDELARSIPGDATVAANPYTGATRLFLAADINLLYPTEWTIEEHPDRLLIGRALDQLDRRADVCNAVRTHAVDYVVTGGSSMSWGEGSASDYRGIEGVGSEPGFTRVASVAPYVLWKVPPCSD